MSMRPIKVKLTGPQLVVARRAIEYSVSVGDCELYGRVVRLPDYEGAQTFQRRVMGLAEPTVCEFISMRAIADKIDVAIVRATEKGAN